jgi:hypothetical protein
MPAHPHPTFQFHCSSLRTKSLIFMPNFPSVGISKDSQVRGPVRHSVMLLTILLAQRPNPAVKAENFSPVLNYLLSTFTATIHIRMLSAPSTSRVRARLL